MLIHFKTLGCRLNEAELETWAQAFQKAGHQITREVSQAHVTIINSCAVTADAARKSRQLIRRIHRENPQGKLVVSGCYATLNEDEAAQLMGVDLVVSNSNKDQLVNQTLSALNFDIMPAMSTEPGTTSLFNRGRQRAFIKVQDGCRYRCTFCIVTVARGEETSRPIETIIEEINSLHQQGINEVILTGVHLGGYGSDLNVNLTTLIESILDKTTVPRIRLGSLEPWDIPPAFFDLFQNSRLMPHLHLPLQSGSNSVLKRMARRCKTDEFSSMVKQARQQITNLNITTDIIVGFPGETEEEWQESYNYIKSIGFGHIHIFTYSQREGTKAATLPNPLPNEIKKQRSKQLHKLAESMKQQFIEKNLGQQYAVLWEGQTQTLPENQKIVFGYTPNYLKAGCTIQEQDSIENKVFKVTLDSISQNYINCTF